MNQQKSFVDMMGRKVELTHKPNRIISLVPSQTELLHYLGLDQEVIGQTLFCIHPEEWHKSKVRVGGTKNFSLDKIDALSPDLIIGNKEENEENGIKALMSKYPVWMSDIVDLKGALTMIHEIGKLCDREEKALDLVNEITQGFANLVKPKTAISCLYLIWRQPWMAAGSDTFISDMLSRIGRQNVAVNLSSRYPELTPEEIQGLAPQEILLSSEPYPFKDKHIAELQALLPGASIKLVDGEIFSWYGSRLLHAIDYFKTLQA